MSTTTVGGAALTQRRNLVTEIPGPRLAGEAGPQEAVRRGRGRHHPAGLRRGGRRRRAPRRRRQLADRPRLRHRGDTVGNAAPRGRPSRAGAGRGVHPHLLHGHAVRRLRRRLRGARRAHPGRPRQEVGAVQLRRRGGRERREDRPRGDRQGRGGGLRPRLPRPHQPDDGDDGEEHAVQERLRAVRRRGLPACRCPTRSARPRASRARTPRPGPSTSSTSRSAPPTSPAS